MHKWATSKTQLVILKRLWQYSPLGIQLKKVMAFMALVGTCQTDASWLSSLWCTGVAGIQSLTLHISLLGQKENYLVFRTYSLFSSLEYECKCTASADNYCLMFNCKLLKRITVPAIRLISKQIDAASKHNVLC